LASLNAQVFRTDPLPEAVADDQVIIARAHPQPGQTSAAIGRNTREERYVVDVIARCLRHRQSSAADAEDAAYALIAAVETSLRAWITETPPFGGVVRWGLAESTEDWNGIDFTGSNREARVTLGVWVTARI
jgi:hypothetical protein